MTARERDDLRIILNASALFAYAHGSVHVGETEVIDEEGRIEKSWGSPVALTLVDRASHYRRRA